MRKNEHVIYRSFHGFLFTARVLRAHRDGTVTIEVKHTIDAEGNIGRVYQGNRFRVSPADSLISAI